MMPSAPNRIMRSAMETVEAKQSTLAPVALAAAISFSFGKLPAKMMYGTLTRSSIARWSL